MVAEANHIYNVIRGATVLLGFNMQKYLLDCD